MTASAVAAAHASEHPTLDPTTGAGCSEAILVCSVIAEHSNVLSCISLELSGERIYTMVKRELMRHDHAHVLTWRSRVPAPEWHVRWNAARKAAPLFYPELPGIADVPDLHALDESAFQVVNVPGQAPPR